MAVYTFKWDSAGFDDIRPVNLFPFRKNDVNCKFYTTPCQIREFSPYKIYFKMVYVRVELSMMNYSLFFRKCHNRPRSFSLLFSSPWSSVYCELTRKRYISSHCIYLHRLYTFVTRFGVGRLCSMGIWDTRLWRVCISTAVWLLHD